MFFMVEKAFELLKRFISPSFRCLSLIKCRLLLQDEIHCTADSDEYMDNISVDCKKCLRTISDVEVFM